MRVTLDTNILISATFWHGNESQIIKLAENGQITLVLSKAILSEFERVLKTRFAKMATESEITEVIEKFISISRIVEPGIKVNMIEENPEDNKILECAITGGATYIISGDKHLLKLKRIHTIKILTSKKFLEILKRR